MESASIWAPLFDLKDSLSNGSAFTGLYRFRLASFAPKLTVATFFLQLERAEEANRPVDHSTSSYKHI